MSAQQVWANDIADTWSDDQSIRRGTGRFQLNSEVRLGVGQADATAHEGDRHWIFVFNDEASSPFAQGDAIVYDADFNEGDGVLASGVAEAEAVLGIAGFTITAGYFGWIVRRGPCEAKSDGNNDAAGTLMTTAASARLAASANSTAGAKAAIGKSQDASGSSAGALYTFLLDLPAV